MSQSFSILLLRSKKVVRVKTLTTQDKLRFKKSPKVFLFCETKLGNYLDFNTIQFDYHMAK